MAQPQHSGAAISILKIRPILSGAGIDVLSEAIDVEGRIADRYSAYHDNISPALSWEAVEGAAGYALIVEDPDAPRDQPFVHWMAWNIPPDITALPEGLPHGSDLGTPLGMVQGRNDNGDCGWFGPRPPAGHGVHRYHFQVFALAKKLKLGSHTPLADLVSALKGDTLADGEVVGTYEAPLSQ